MIKRVLVLIIGIYFILPSVFAQTPNDTLIAYQYYKTGDSLREDDKRVLSNQSYKKALTIYKKAKAWRRVLACYNMIAENQLYLYKFEESLKNSHKATNISDIYFTNDIPEKAVTYDNFGLYYEENSNFSQALIYYQKALDIRQKILGDKDLSVAKSYSNVAVVYYKIGEYEKSVSLQEKALEIKINELGEKHHKLGVQYNNLGIIYADMGMYSKAIEYYKKDIEISINAYGEDHFFIAFSYANIANIYLDLLQENKAIDYYEKALRIFIKHKKPKYESYVYINLGNLYTSINKNKKALVYLKKALPMLTKLYSKEHESVLKTIRNIGAAYSSLGEYDTSFYYHQKALSITLDFYGEDHPDVAHSYFDFGRDYVKKKEYKTALEYYNKGLTILKKYGTAYNNFIIETYNNIGKIHFFEKDYINSIRNYEEAIFANTISDTKNTSTISTSIDYDKYINLITLLNTLIGKAEAYQQLYVQNGNLTDLKKSENKYEDSDALIGFLRKKISNYKDKVFFSIKGKDVYSGAIQTQILLNETKIPTGHFVEKAFYYAEKSKANTLKEVLNDFDAKAFAKLPPEIIELEKRLKSIRSFYQSQILAIQSKNKIDTAKIAKYENIIFDQERRQDSLKEVLQKEFPKYYQLKHKNDIVSISTIQQQLDTETTILEFFTSDSITHVFSISKDTIVVEKLGTPQLKENIIQFRKAIVSENIPKYKKLAGLLYRQLIVPIKENLKNERLIVIPDGPIWFLNFDLLLTHEKEVNSIRELPYLLKKHAISYANSANVLFDSYKNINIDSNVRKECLAFSFSDSIRVGATNGRKVSLAALRDSEDDLPGTRKEIKAISEIVDGEYYYGVDAIEANFKQNADQFSILHLAVHGEVDHDNPQNSKLYFTKSKDTLEDNVLYSHELFALNIPADLTVLSACNTGVGQVANGEGIMSLGTAFQYAGTKSLLLSSWEVSDRTTPILMKYFYANLNKGMHKDKALQQAKLKFINTADTFYTNPFYWGSFYLLGDSAPLIIDTPTDVKSIYWILLVFVLVCFFLIFFYFKKKSN